MIRELGARGGRILRSVPASCCFVKFTLGGGSSAGHSFGQKLLEPHLVLADRKLNNMLELHLVKNFHSNWKFEVHSCCTGYPENTYGLNFN